MSAEDDRQTDEYLWDPAAPPVAAVDAIARTLAPARYDAARRPLTLPATPRGRRRAYAGLLAIAATLAILAGGASAFWSWRWSWTAGAPWPVSLETPARGASSLVSQLRLDQPLQVGAAAARVGIARIGTMTVEPGSTLTLTETTSTRHRVVLDRGVVNVRVWAPPGRLAFRTPAGAVIDLGCVFALSVDADGTSRVRVDTGWVQMENASGETLVPAGASSVMTAAVRPGVPVFDDAPAAFVSSVRAAERTADEAAAIALVERAAEAARPRDVLTLLMLANTSRVPLKRALLERAAQLVPPPAGVSVAGILSGNRDQVWRWSGSLDLPPAKNWWRNWRDALPRLR
jgi:hypothetical protein